MYIYNIYIHIYVLIEPGHFAHHAAFLSRLVAAAVPPAAAAAAAAADAAAAFAREGSPAGCVAVQLRS